MIDEAIAQLPPLQGCLYCHSEGTMVLSEGRRFLGFGSDYPILRCSHCESVACLDVDPTDPARWRIRYRRVNHDSVYFYASIHLGKAGWLSAQKALEVSTHSFVQRKRVLQAGTGDLSWLQPQVMIPPLPLMDGAEQVFLTLKGVTLQTAPPPGLWVRTDSGDIKDSGKFFVTGQRLHLLGQRRDWSHELNMIRKVTYDSRAWAVTVSDADGQLQQYRGVDVPGQMDAQLVSTVVEVLWQRAKL
jgi:hypothetical protein